MLETLLPVLFAAVVGFGHAFEADHLLAVANIVSKRNSLSAAIRDGIAWGLGHTSTILLVGLLIIGFKVAISEQTFHYLEAGVGLMLVGLGAFRLYYSVKTGQAPHTHIHLDDLLGRSKNLTSAMTPAPYQFNVFTAKNTAVSALRFAPERHPHRLAYSVGLVHGLAGSGTLIVLVMSQIQELSLSIAYLLIFGIGSIGGMLIASGLFSLPFSQKLSSHRRLQQTLTVVSALLCIAYGMKVIWENIYSHSEVVL